MNLKNKCLLDGWILMASKVYRRENLSCRFEDWLYCLCKIMKFFWTILMSWKHRHLGNMRFFACAKIVFHTLENLIDQGFELCSEKWKCFSFILNRSLIIELNIRFFSTYVEFYLNRGLIIELNISVFST